MKFEIKVTSDEGETFSGQGATMTEAAAAFCNSMAGAPDPFCGEACDSWDKFQDDTVELAELEKRMGA